MLRSRFLGGMLGLALGDAIGELAFHSPQEPALRSQITDAGRLIYTDDTAMAIGLAESILQIGHLDSQHLIEAVPRRGWKSWRIAPIFSA